jgi:hypothetical protein
MRLLPFVIACTLAAAALPARAEEDPKTERARVHLKAAIAYYDEARYEEAAKEMQVAYDLKPVADLQYNLAQCWERLGRLEDAAASYERYLAGRPDAADAKSVRARIENLRERARALAAGSAAPPPPPPVEKVVFKTIVVYRETPPPPGRAARWAAGGLWALAVAGAASGIAFAVVAKSAADDVTRAGSTATPPEASTVRATEESGKTAVIVSGVSFGIGALALAGGGVLWWLGKKVDREAPKVTLAPSWSPTGGGLVVAGAF